MRYLISHFISENVSQAKSLLNKLEIDYKTNDDFIKINKMLSGNGYTYWFTKLFFVDKVSFVELENIWNIIKSEPQIISKFSKPIVKLENVEQFWDEYLMCKGLSNAKSIYNQFPSLQKKMINLKNNDDILLLNDLFKDKEIDMFIKKISRYHNREELINAIKLFLYNKSSNNFYVLLKSLKEDKVNIKYASEENDIIVCTVNYPQIRKFGSDTSWCIVQSEGTFNSYNIDYLSQQFVIFLLDKKDNYSKIGITTNINGFVTAHLKNDRGISERDVLEILKLRNFDISLLYPSKENSLELSWAFVPSSILSKIGFTEDEILLKKRKDILSLNWDKLSVYYLIESGFKKGEIVKKKKVFGDYTNMYYDKTINKYRAGTPPKSDLEHFNPEEIEKYDLLNKTTLVFNDLKSYTKEEIIKKNLINRTTNIELYQLGEIGFSYNEILKLSKLPKFENDPLKSDIHGKSRNQIVKMISNYHFREDNKRRKISILVSIREDDISLKHFLSMFRNTSFQNAESVISFLSSLYTIHKDDISYIINYMSHEKYSITLSRFIKNDLYKSECLQLLENYIDKNDRFYYRYYEMNTISENLKEYPEIYEKLFNKAKEFLIGGKYPNVYYIKINNNSHDISIDPTILNLKFWDATNTLKIIDIGNLFNNIGISNSLEVIKYCKENGYDLSGEDGFEFVLKIKGSYEKEEDCAGWGLARKTFSNSQNGDFTTFRRCFGRWEGSTAQGPKKTFQFSYNSYNALLENCIATWDSLKMPQNYNLIDYYGQVVIPTQSFTNYEVQQPDGIFSHDGFDVLPDVANARLYGCIAFLQASQRYHNSFKLWACPFAVEIKGVEIKDCISYIEPGSYTSIWNENFASIGPGYNSVTNYTGIGGDIGHISSDWTQSHVYQSTICGTISTGGKSIPNPNLTNTGAVVMKKYVDGVLTNEDLWPWPMNQRIIDGMTQSGYTGSKVIDVTSTVFGFCGGTAPSINTIIQKASTWLSSTASRTTQLEADLSAFTGNITTVMNAVKPVPSATATGEIFYQNYNNSQYANKYNGLTSGTGKPLMQFHMYVPTSYTPNTAYGMILWMHGGGSYDVADNEIGHLAAFDMDNETITGRSYPRTETDNSNYILVAPLAPYGNLLPHPLHASRWDVPSAEQYLIDTITEVSGRYNINPNKIVIAGYSMGGIGAYHMAIRLNDRAAAVMASAGSWEIANWEALKDTPVYIIHGVTDAYYNSPTDARGHYTPIEGARLAYTILSRYSNIHSLNEYPGGHQWDNTGQAAWTNFINGQSGWVTTKVRNPYKSNVIAVNAFKSYEMGDNFNVQWFDNPSPHTMWVSINSYGTSSTIQYEWAKVTGDGSTTSLTAFNGWTMSEDVKNIVGGKAIATITGANQISVTASNVTSLSLWLHPNMVDFNKPIIVRLNGITTLYNIKPSLLDALKSYERRWDWGMIYHKELVII